VPSQISATTSGRRRFFRLARIPWFLWAFLAHEGIIVLAYGMPYPNFPGIQHRAFSRLGHFWFQWDALWYIAIARHGYAHLPGVPPLAGTAFFPWVPLLIHVFGVWGAFFLTQAAFLSSLWLFQRLCLRLQWTPTLARDAVLFLALNPASMYYATLYAEPWTLFLTLTSIEFGSRQRWLWASLAGLAAATTQATGILIGLFPLVLFVTGLRHRSYRTALGPMLWGIGPATGMASYAYYLESRFHHALLFSSVQSTPYWDGHWRWPWLQWFQAIHRALSLRPPDLTLLALWLAISLLAVGAFLLVYPWPQAQLSSPERIGVSLYGLIGLLVSLSFYHGNTPLYSTVRIVSIYFPLYGGLSRTPATIRYAALALFIGLAFTGALLFTHQWWYQ
jgi:hypothetical protein